MLTFGGPRSHERQGTGSAANEFVLYLLKSEIIGGGALPPGLPDVRHYYVALERRHCQLHLCKVTMTKPTDRCPGWFSNVVRIINHKDRGFFRPAILTIYENM